jgi:16S rRNA (guanine966-N2)-methyltransferase
MRIISGALKGKPILFLKSSITRPLKDSVKENIFNILIHSSLLNITVKKSNILDLYSGIGSFGLECISRGASRITFVEKNENIVEILKKNLLSLSVQDKAIVVKDKISVFLGKKNNNKFEIIFLDPPFAENTYIEELKLIYEKKIYKKNHLVIIHREEKSIDNFKNILNPIIIKKYGRSKIIFGKFLN